VKHPLLLKAMGVVFALFLWQIVASSHVLGDDFGSSFSPVNALTSLFHLAVSGDLLKQAVPSLKRIFVGMTAATFLGVVVGIVIGLYGSIQYLTYTPFQFIRMTSPLAWMPIAIILLGIGDRPIYFLIAVAAVWPVIINTYSGVRRVSRIWIEVIKTLGGNDWLILTKVIVPAVIPHVMTGLKVAVGISWIILVPAEMLGVSSGLGYFILDCRDRFSYDEMMAVILVIGMVGLILDSLIGILQDHYNWSL
jgi:NitT/TauT family transport system permease protein